MSNFNPLKTGMKVVSTVGNIMLAKDIYDTVIKPLVTQSREEIMTDFKRYINQTDHQAALKKFSQGEHKAGMWDRFKGQKSSRHLLETLRP